MGSMDIIKSYLVSLGFAVDDKGFKDANRAIDSVGDSATKMAEGVVGDFAKAGIGIVAFVATAVTGIAKFISGLGQAQIQNEIFARRMWTTQESAMALNSTLKAMGVTLQDLYLSPTLMAQFQALNKEAKGLQAPSEYKDQMTFIQSITFEFTRMKLEASYSLQWIGYYFVKYMAGPLGQVKGVLDNINDIIVKTMPQWTRVIAIGLVDIVKFGETIWWALTQVGSFVKSLSELIPTNVKIIAGALFLLSSPIGIIIAGLLLLQDYLTFKSGGKSVFKGLWEDTDNFMKKLGDKGALTEFYNIVSNLGTAFGDLASSLMNTGKDLGDLLNKLSNLAGFKDFNDFLSSTFTNTLITIDKLVQSIDDGLKILNGFAIGDGQSAIDGVLANGKKSNAEDKKKGGFWGFNAGLSDAFGDIISQFNHFFDNNPTTQNSSNGASSNSSIWGILTDPKKWAINNMSATNGPMSYMYPQTNSSSNHINNTLNQTNHIYGSNSGSTVEAIKTGAKDIVRNWQGVVI